MAIFRWPRRISVVAPASFCPACERPIPVHLNIPVFSYFLLRGKSACCGSRLSPRYPLVEAAAALLCLGIAERYLIGAPPTMGVVDALMIALTYFIFVGGLLIAAFIDLDFMEIPDEVSLPVAALGLATATLRVPDQVDSMVLGAGCGYLLVQVVFVWTYERLTGRRGMGEGDSKLMLMIGAFVGWQGAVFSLLAGATQGLAAFVIARLAGKSLVASPESEERAETQADVAEPAGPEEGEVPAAADTDEEHEYDPEPPPRYFGHLKVPFGPFLALSAAEYLFFGDRLMAALLLR